MSTPSSNDPDWRPQGQQRPTLSQQINLPRPQKQLPGFSSYQVLPVLGLFLAVLLCLAMIFIGLILSLAGKQDADGASARSAVVTGVVEYSEVKNECRPSTSSSSDASCAERCLTHISYTVGPATRTIIAYDVRGPVVAEGTDCSFPEDGSTLNVYYDPAHPQDARADREESNGAGWTGLALTSLGVFGFVGATVLMARLSSKRPKGE